MPKPAQPPSEDERYKVEDAMRTLTRAEQIKADTKLMGKVRVAATEIKRVAGRAPVARGGKK